MLRREHRARGEQTRAETTSTATPWRGRLARRVPFGPIRAPGASRRPSAPRDRPRAPPRDDPRVGHGRRAQQARQSGTSSATTRTADDWAARGTSCAVAPSRARTCGDRGLGGPTPRSPLSPSVSATFPPWRNRRNPPSRSTTRRSFSNRSVCRSGTTGST